MSKKLRKEDMNYAARIADGMEVGGELPKTKSHKFKNGTSVNTGGVVRPFFEDKTPLDTFLEAIEQEKNGISSIDFGSTQTMNSYQAAEEVGQLPDGGVNNPTEEAKPVYKKVSKKNNKLLRCKDIETESSQ